MSKTFKVTLAAIAAITMVACASTAVQVNSLRGKSVSTADDNALQVKEYVGKRPGQTPLIVRNFEAQPPLIPHTIENYEISATENACWDCHNSDDFKGKKMPMVGKSHLIGPVVADVTPKLNMQRWQCDTCHVPQVDAQPLVDNVFQGNISRQ
jgi:cytochrome c-type protein NapB